jgi:hypothetical protein
MSDEQPSAIAERRRKKKGERGAWHYLIRVCPFCGRSHSHLAPGLQRSHCVNDPRTYEVVEASPKGSTMKASTRQTPISQDQAPLIPPATRRSNAAPNIDPRALRGNQSSVDPRPDAPRGAGITQPKV